ncbi:MAG: UDP-N-acetylglucosamine--LPS N-acetylglucosamine transferase [Pseudomonadota bacterium]
MAVGSAGGHWQQLLELRDAYVAEDVHYVTTLKGLPEQFNLTNYTIVRDCNRDQKLDMAICAFGLLITALRKRPNVVVTTGALPGLLAIMIGKVIGARTIWIDSIANAEELSLSGQIASRHADLCLSQWAHVAKEGKVQFEGSIL